MNVSEVMNLVIENNKAAMAPFNALAEITQRAVTKNAEAQMAVAREYMAFGTKSVETLSAAKDPKALMTEQVAIAKELGEKAMANAEAFTKLAAETQAELKDWAEGAAKVAQDVVKDAQEAVVKAA